MTLQSIRHFLPENDTQIGFGWLFNQINGPAIVILHQLNDVEAQFVTFLLENAYCARYLNEICSISHLFEGFFAHNSLIWAKFAVFGCVYYVTFKNP